MAISSKDGYWTVPDEFPEPPVSWNTWVIPSDTYNGEKITIKKENNMLRLVERFTKEELDVLVKKAKEGLRKKEEDTAIIEIMEVLEKIEDTKGDLEADKEILKAFEESLDDVIKRLTKKDK